MPYTIGTMAIDAYKRESDRLHKERDIKQGIPEERKDTLSLQKIMNGQDSVLFGEMLRLKGGHEDLYQRLIDGKMEANDIDTLEDLRVEFAEKMYAAENIQKELTTELVGEMGVFDPEFEKIAKLVGAEKTASFIKGTLKEIAITDNVQFEQISDSVKALQSFRDGDMKRLDEEIKDECKKEGFNADEFARTLAIVDDEERQKAMNELVKKKWDRNGFGKLKRALNIGGIFSNNEARTLDSVKIQIDSAYATLDGYKKDVGSVLASIIGNNDELIAAMSRKIVGVPEKKELPPSMNDVKESVPDDADYQNAWQEHRKNLPNWGSMNDAEQNAARDTFHDSFLTKTKNQIRGQGGFWSSIFGGLLQGIFAGFDKSSLK